MQRKNVKSRRGGGGGGGGTEGTYVVVAWRGGVLHLKYCPPLPAPFK